MQEEELIVRFMIDYDLYIGLLNHDPEDVALRNMTKWPRITWTMFVPWHKFEFHKEA